MRLTRSPARRVAGLTLIELLVVVTLLGISLSLAAPAMAAILNSMKLSSQANVLLAHLHLARSEAVKRNARVVVCKSTTGAACAAEGGWEQGWIVFMDANNNASLDAGDVLIQRQSAFPPGFSLSGNTNVANYVSYSGIGATKLTSGAFQAGTFTLCRQSTSSTSARQIFINITGRSRTASVTVSSCP